MLNAFKDNRFLKLAYYFALAITIYFLFFSRLDFFAIPRLKIEDFFCQLRYKTRKQPNYLDRMVLISADDESYRILNKRLPWERKMFGDLLDKIRDAKPRVVSMDFTFVGDSSYPDDDEIFAQALAKSGNVVLAAYFDPEGKYMLPLHAFRERAAGVGLVNKPRDADFFIRQARVFTLSLATLKPKDYSFEIKTFAKYMGASFLKKDTYNGREIVLVKDDGSRILIPACQDGTIPVNFRIQFNDFKTISFWRIIQEKFPEETFKDKIVLVGPTAEIFHDVYHTPLGLMPGVLIEANNILMFLNRDFINYLPRYIEFLIILALGFLVVYWTYIFSPLPSFLMTITGLISYLAIGWFMFLRNIRFDYFSGCFIMIIVYLSVTLIKFINLWIENAKLRTLAITDGLTGLFIHRYFLIRMQNEFERALRYNMPFSFAIMDIDHFKSINDNYGHEEGNVVLKNIASILNNQSRKTDLVARYGGEEFCAILTHTSQEGARLYGERVRRAVEEFEFPYKSGKPLKITISIGVVTFPDFKAKAYEDLIEAADKALYHAKNSGRNRICIFEEKMLNPGK